jgi:nucleotide-binding universal stress UspA family protein
MKSILANVASGHDVAEVAAGTDVAGDYAVSLAAAFDAHVLGVVFAYVPTIRRSAAHTTAARLIEERRQASEAAAQAAAARFDEAARRAGVSAASHVFDATLPGAPDIFGPLARRFDLAIVGQPEPNKVAPEDLIIEAALFDSGRPVIVVPYIHTAPFKLDRVLVAWDGSRAAARALGDAMPFIDRAAAVDVVIVTTEPVKSDEIPGADVAEMLARHGVRVDVRRIGAAGISVADTILNQAAESAADLIIMGGYGRSRLREFVLGGTTRAMLTSMTTPVLMSH